MQDQVSVPVAVSGEAVMVMVTAAPVLVPSALPVTTIVPAVSTKAVAILPATVIVAPVPKEAFDGFV